MCDDVAVTVRLPDACRTWLYSALKSIDNQHIVWLN